MSLSNSVVFQPHFIPLYFVIKYEASIIALLYKVSTKDNKKRKYEIHLNSLAQLTDVDYITQQLFNEHQLFLNTDIFTYAQLKRLVQKVVDYNQKHSSQKNFFQTPQKNKKSSSNFTNQLDKSIKHDANFNQSFEIFDESQINEDDFLFTSNKQPKSNKNINIQDQNVDQYLNNLGKGKIGFLKSMRN